MKIISWNVNGLKARLEAVNRLCQEQQPDVICCQKVRTKGNGFIAVPGYFTWWGSMSGGLFGDVSTFMKSCKGIELDYLANVPRPSGWLLDTGCVLALNFDHFILVNTYFPYSNLSNEEFIKTRQRWDYEIHQYLVKVTNWKPLIVCGDMNIVATDLDAWDNVSVKKQGCFLEWEHRNFNTLLEATGLVDSYRHFHPEGREYSYFFNNKPEYRLANQGFRIDYFLVSESLLPYVKKSEILTDVFDTTNNPILLEIDF